MSDHPLLKPSTNVLADNEFKHSKYNLLYVAYEVSIHDILPINDYDAPTGQKSSITVAATNSAGFCFCPVNRFDALRLIPDTEKGRYLLDPDWKLILLMRKTVSDSEIWLKGAFHNRVTGRLALLTIPMGRIIWPVSDLEQWVLTIINGQSGVLGCRHRGSFGVNCHIVCTKSVNSILMRDLEQQQYYQLNKAWMQDPFKLRDLAHHSSNNSFKQSAWVHSGENYGGSIIMRLGQLGQLGHTILQNNKKYKMCVWNVCLIDLLMIFYKIV